jgi:hypothetical protein
MARHTKSTLFEPPRQARIDSLDEVVVGVNKYRDDDAATVLSLSEGLSVLIYTGSCIEGCMKGL